MPATVRRPLHKKTIHLTHDKSFPNMQTPAIKFVTGLRVLLLLAVIPALTNCSRIDGSVELNNSSGDPYSFEGAKVEVFDLNRSAVLAGLFPAETRIPKGLGSVEADGTISAQVITATIDDDALYDLEIHCPAGNTADTCNVKSPLHVVLSGEQLKAGGWNVTALTEATFQNIGYYAAVGYSVAEIAQMLDTYASVLLTAVQGSAKTYADLLAWDPTLTHAVRRPRLLASVSDSLAAGISNNDLKLLARQWISPIVTSFDLTPEPTSTVYDIRIIDNYAYVSGYGFGFRVIDIHDPEQPIEVGQTQDVWSRQPIIISGNVAYLQGENAQHEAGVQIVDISNPTKPTVTGQFSLTGTLQGVSGNYAYVTTLAGLQIFNISNPQQPLLTGQITIANAGSLVLSGNYVYLIADEVLHIVDISNPAAPTAVGTLPISNALSHSVAEVNARIEIAETHVYVTTYDFFNGLPGLTVVDISNAAAPTQTGQLTLPSGGTANYMTTSHEKIYLTSYYWLLTIDVSDPAAPTLTQKLNTFGNATYRALAVADDFIHAITSGTGYSVIDPTAVTPSAVQSGRLTTHAYATGHAALSGQYAYTLAPGSGIDVIDLSNPVAPALLPGLYGHAIGSTVASGDHAFLGDVEFGSIRIADISNPAAPSMLPDEVLFDNDGEFFGLNDIALSGDHIFAPWGFPGDNDESGVAHGQMGCTNPNGGNLGGLFAVDVSAPEKPLITSHICLPNEADVVAAKGSLAYVAIAGNLLQVVDYSNPAQPVLAGSTHLYAPAYFLATSNNFIWATEGSEGVEIVDVSDAAAPIVVTHINTPGFAGHVVFDGHYAYVADGIAGLLIFDITQAAAPALVASASTRGNATSIFLLSDYLYSTSSDGIEVLKKMPPSN